jgi:alpha-glucuronidase
VLTLLILVAGATAARAEDGYELWLRYHRVADAARLKHFQTFSKRPIADECGPPANTLEHYMSINLRFVPGN